MITISIKTTGMKSAQDFIGTIAKQMPYVTARALTATARNVRDEVVVELPNHINNPVAFTRHAFGYQSATKRKLQARVFAKSIQAQYLWWAVEGGTQDAMIQPANIKINKYGNIPRGRIKKLMARPDVFYATVKGITGVWQRGKYRGDRFHSQVRTRRGARKQISYQFAAGQFRGLRLLVARKSSVQYKTRFDFYGLARRIMEERWDGNLTSAWKIVLYSSAR